jgi:hypothetical protein
MKIPVEILKLKGPDGVERYKAIISFQDAIADTSQSGKLIQIQDEYIKLVAQLTNLWKAIEKNRQNMANSRNQWKLADMINSLVKFVENEGHLLTNAVEALSRDVGMSKSQLNYLRKFRDIHQSIKYLTK